MTVMCFVGFLAYRDRRTSREYGGWVRHTHDVLDSISALIAATTMADSNGRAFVITGDEYYDQRRRANETRARQIESDLRRLTADNNVQQALVL